jgi:hypothetical protein
MKKFKGLYHKYDVVKKDGKVVSNFFVLRPDRDPAARAALITYAQVTDNTILKDEIEQWVRLMDKKDSEEVA